MQYLVGLNGPPYCGKDTLGRMLLHKIELLHDVPVKIEHLSLPLRVIAHSMIGEIYRLETYAEFKKTPFLLGGRRVTGRQLMIDVSEKFLKTVYGRTIMADLFIERNRNFHGLIIVCDSGFQLEVQPLEEHYGQDNCYFVRLHREGKTFEGDSRERVYSTHDTDIYNDGTLRDLETEAGRIYGRLVNQMRWSL